MEQPKGGFLAAVFSALFAPFIRLLDKPSRPQYEGSLTLHGLEKSVRVKWDRFAIPHVTAASEPDLFLAQGYLHAQERLWQMEMSRRLFSGRMAEIFGDFSLPWRDLSTQFRGRSCADFDYFLRLLGLRPAAAASLDILPEQAQLRLRAYCDGVNRYIEQCAGKLPWEFRLLRHEPELWCPEDTLTIGKGLAFTLSTALFTRLNFIAVASKFQDDPEKLRKLIDRFNALQTERGASRHTLTAYRRDLTDFTRFLARAGHSLGDVGPDDVVSYLEHARARGLKPASIARRLARPRVVG